MTDASTRIDSDSLPWRETPYPGVQWKKLRFDRVSGESAVLLRFEPGSRYGAHRHPEGEQYLVLEGSLQDGEQTWGAGAYVHHPPDSVHAPSSVDGCILFVTVPKPIEIVDRSS